MSGYSPTWTSKGSDHLRALQTTKILMNSLYRIISLFEINNKTKEPIVEAIGATILKYFTPNRELELEKQFDLLAEFLGWKTFNVEHEEGGHIIVTLGGNRFLNVLSNDPIYILIVTGVAKAFGYLVYQSNVEVEPIIDQFQSQQVQVIIKPLTQPIPQLSRDRGFIDIDTEKLSKETVSLERQTAISMGEADVEVKPTIEIELENIFSPILRNFPTAKIMPIFHQILSEVEKTFFNELEDNKVKKAKAIYSDEHIKYLIEFILVAAKDSSQDLKEIANMVGKYVITAYRKKYPEDLTKFLSKELVSTVARRVSYIEFPARAFCTYAPGEKCVKNKRDLCDFVLHMWEGMLSEILPEKGFTVGERIPATRRGKYCLAEFLKKI